MKKDKLTCRQKRIIEILACEKSELPIIISNIADRLGVSTRTILREMPYVEKWINDNGFKFIKKPGVGLKFDESEEGKEELLNILQSVKVKKKFSKDQRKEIILDELKKSEEPLKLYYFTSLLNVSEGTLINDFHELEKDIEGLGFLIKRKQGVGIYLEYMDK